MYAAVRLCRVANPRPVAKIKTGRISQLITDADDATGLELQRAPGLPWNLQASKQSLTSVH